MACSIDINGTQVWYVVRAVSSGNDLVKFNATGAELPQNKWRSKRLPSGTEPKEFLCKLLGGAAVEIGTAPSTSVEKAGHTPVQLSPDAPVQPNQKQLRLPGSVDVDAMDTQPYSLRTEPAQPERFSESDYSKIGGYKERELELNPGHQRVRPEGESYAERGAARDAAVEENAELRARLTEIEARILSLIEVRTRTESIPCRLPIVFPIRRHRKKAHHGAYL